MRKVRGRAAATLGVLRTALRNRSLRRALVAFLLFNTQEYAVWVAVAVYAFQQGGAGEAGAVLVLQLVPAAIVAPIGSVLADRIPRAKALVLGYGLQTCANLLLGVCLIEAAAPSRSSCWRCAGPRSACSRWRVERCCSAAPMMWCSLGSSASKRRFR